MAGLTDGQVVGGLVFVVVPLVLLGLLWAERRLEEHAAARRARARTRDQVLDELATRRDEARGRRREKVLLLNASHPHPYRSRLAAQKLRELGEGSVLDGSSVTWADGTREWKDVPTDEWLAGEPEHPDDPYL